MRHLLPTLLLLFVVTSCDKGTPRQLLDPNAQLSINVVSGTEPRSDGESPKTTPIETLKKIGAMYYRYPGAKRPAEMGIPEDHKDYEKLCIKLFGTFIIHQNTPPHKDGELNEEFIRATDVLFTSDAVDHGGDTVAYIPNRALKEAYVKVLVAYEAGNVEEVYKLFREAYTAVPITGAEYRELKAKGLN